MDFLSFFGLNEDPFKLTPDPAYFYPSSSHNEGLMLMDYSLEQKEGFLLVIGDPGTGKTTMLKVFLEKWRSGAEIAMVLTPGLSPEEFLVTVADDLKIDLQSSNKNAIIKSLLNFMMQKSEEDRRVIIIVDEAQNLPAETLEELRLLSNLETDKDKLLHIILLGQPELESKLTSNTLRQLNQRITTRIHLKHFNEEETLEYIKFRSIKAGRENLHIHKKAGKIINKITNGTPRLINMVISRALMAAYLDENNTILPDHIHHAVKSLNHSDLNAKKINSLIPASVFLILVFLVISGLTYYLYMQKTDANIITNEQVKGEQENTTYNENSRSDDDSNINGGLQYSDIKLISVKVQVANIRTKPSIDSEKLGQTYMHNQFIVLDKFTDSNYTIWYNVPFLGEKGWIAGWLVDEIDLKNINENKPLTVSPSGFSE